MASQTQVAYEAVTASADVKDDQSQLLAACAAAVAGVCAARQDRFWEYGQVLFDNQKALETDDLVKYAADVDLDTALFQSCLDDPDAMTQVKYDIGLAMRLDVKATPTFFVNGYPVTGAFPVPILSAVIDQIAAYKAGT